MTYEIPQKLHYEEKIIFGLTFRQLVYVPFFIIPALMIYLKSHLPFLMRIALSALLAAIGILFMFFNLLGYLKNLVSWMRFREARMTDQKMKEFLGLKKVEKQVLYVERK